MSWLKLDDGFADHPKVLELARPDRWRWVELLVSCARHGTNGAVSAGMLRRADITAKLVARLVALGLLERHPDGELHVHDWADYNPPRDPTNAERQARWRANKRLLVATHKGQHADRADGMDTGIEQERNALPVTVPALPPVPVPLEPTPPTPPRAPSDDPSRTSGRVGNLEALDPVAELARLRALAGDAPSWPPGDAGKGDPEP